jgi:ribonuclease P protein component
VETPWLESRRGCAPSDDEGWGGNGARVSNPGSDAAGTNVTRRFPKTSKLLRRADFQRVYQQGRRHFAAHMTVFYLRRRDQEAGGPRVGLTVGRVLGGAVERNRIKRRLREAVRYNLALLAVPVDVVMNPRKSALSSPFGVLKDEVARAFQIIVNKESPRGAAGS